MTRRSATIVTQVSPPESGPTANWCARPDLLDSYAVDLPHGHADVGVIARAMTAHPPLWMRLLFTMRDAAVRLFGVKTRADLRMAAGTDHVDFFPVLFESADDLLLGADDRHLDFRAEMKIDRDGARDRLVMTTVVRCHNRLGRAYLSIIAPFHRLIVQSQLARAGGYQDGSTI